MGRCVACNKNLSDVEATRKSATTGEYIDMCNHCFSTIADEIPHIEGSCINYGSPEDEETFDDEEWGDN